MSKLYGCLPSELLGVKDSYTAFCFNEACSYILLRLQNGDEMMRGGKGRLSKEKYSSFSDLYRDVDKVTT